MSFFVKSKFGREVKVSLLEALMCPSIVFFLFSFFFFQGNKILLSKNALFGLDDLKNQRIFKNDR